jgi:hypothetical protein
VSCSAGIAVSRGCAPTHREATNTKKEFRKTTKNASCRFRENKGRESLLLFTLNTEALWSTETLVNAYHITPRYIPDVTSRMVNQEIKNKRK